MISLSGGSGSVNSAGSVTHALQTAASTYVGSSAPRVAASRSPAVCCAMTFDPLEDDSVWVNRETDCVAVAHAERR